jgi:AcrR family transcriptional regulator
VHEQKSDRLDPRAARSQHRAIEATLALVRETGVGRMSIESIAARSGVARTTLYRQFGDLETLLFAAFESLKRPQVIPVRKGVVADVEAWMQAFAVLLYSDGFSGLMPAMIEVAERTERGRELAVEFAARRRLALQERLRTAIDQGELDPGLDIDATVSMLSGPLFYRRFISRQPSPPECVSQLVRSVLASSVVSSTW